MGQRIRRTIEYSCEDRIGTIILNRPRQLNALNRQMFGELHDALKEVSKDEVVRVLVLTGSRKAFCFGIDLQEAVSWAPDVWDELLPMYQDIILTLVEMSKPTIAAINGFATGAGLDLALACDLRIAAPGAKLGEAFVKQGLVPDGGGSFFLPRLVGLARAAELIFTGEAISAHEAERIGLINRVVPTKELLQEAQILALQLARQPRRALVLAKRNLYRDLSLDVRSALELEAAAQKRCLEAGSLQKGLKSDRTTGSDVGKS